MKKYFVLSVLACCLCLGVQASPSPVEAVYHHDETWHDGNGNAHILAAMIGSSVTIPVVDGILFLGHWQQIVLVDFDNKHRSRTICVQICM